MKITKTILLTIWLIGLCTAGLKAQHGQYAAGGDTTGSGGSISYTAGQPCFITLFGSGGTMTEGIQQPFEILVISGIEETGIELSCTAFPNPATNYILLSVREYSTHQLTYQVYNTAGKMLINEKATGDQTKISLIELSDAVYFIKVLNRNKELKTFKIIKNS